MTWDESFLVTLGRIGWMLLGVLTLLLLSAFPFEFAHLGAVRPAFMLMAVYYWTILRSPAPPAPAVFIVGLLLDFIAAYPLGMNALVLVAVQWSIKAQRKFLLGQSFAVIWAGFFLVALAAGGVEWLLFSLFNLALVPLQPVLLSIILSTLLFPVMAWPLSALHRATTERPEA